MYNYYSYIETIFENICVVHACTNIKFCFKGTLPLEKKSFIIRPRALKFSTEMLKVILRLFYSYFLSTMHIFRFFWKNSKFWYFLKRFHRGCNFEGRTLQFFTFGSLFVRSQNLVVYIPIPGSFSKKKTDFFNVDERST